MATLPKNKKEFISSLKAQNIDKVEGKLLKKCTVAILRNAFLKLHPELAPKVEEKKEEKKEVAKDVPTTEEVANMDVAALMQKAKEVAKAAQEEGEKNKEEIVKPTKARKSKWSDVIPLLLASQSNQNKDGSYTFSLQEVIDLTGMPTTNSKTGKPASWTIYSGDWKPTYKGIGSNVVLLGHQAQVKGAPSKKEAREQFDATQATSWSLTLSPITPEQQIALMQPRLKGSIKNWVYTQQQYNAVKAKLEAQDAQE